MRRGPNAHGGVCARAVINQPQSAILAVSGLDEKLVVDPESEKGFKAIQTIKVTLSADHRIVDGAIAARWSVQS